MLPGSGRHGGSLDLRDGSPGTVDLLDVKSRLLWLDLQRLADAQHITMCLTGSETSRQFLSLHLINKHHRPSRNISPKSIDLGRVSESTLVRFSQANSESGIPT